MMGGTRVSKMKRADFARKNWGISQLRLRFKRKREKHLGGGGGRGKMLTDVKNLHLARDFGLKCTSGKRNGSY